MRIKWYVSDFHACGYVRGEVIARAVNKYYAPHNIDIKSNVVLSDFYGTDLMVFQRQHTVEILEKLRVAKQMGITTVYELDDDFFNTPEEFDGPWKFYSDPKIQEIITAFLNEADHVTVSTNPLRRAMRERTKRPVTIVENSLDVDFWVREKPRNEEPIIGWMASGSHMIDAPLIENPIIQILQEYPKIKVMMIGLMGFDNIPKLKSFEDRVMVMNWQDSSILPDRMRHIDIGLAPLRGHPYNDSKSGVKALQYWANRTPIICSPSPAYMDLVSHDVNALIADGDEQWYRGMKTLIDNQNDRDRLGNAGFKLLTEKYDIRKFAMNWLDLFSSLI